MYGQIFLYDKYPTVFGYGKTTITDTEYAKDYDNDDYIITKNESEYNVGDTVVYVNLRRQIVVDEITEISFGRFYFKDNHSLIIFQNNIKGKVIKVIPKVGSFFSFAEGPIGTTIILIVILMLFELPKVIKKYSIKKRIFSMVS